MPLNSDHFRENGWWGFGKGKGYEVEYGWGGGCMTYKGEEALRLISICMN